MKQARSGHLPTLIASLLHFDLSFMLWVLLGALGVYAAESAGLTPAAKGWMVAVPILVGSVLRVPVGLLSDQIGGKRMGLALLCFLFIPLTLAWRMPANLNSLAVVGLFLGAAGASFAVALPLASRWYPPERQGLVMGIAAAGNSGTVLTNLIAPRLADRFGWQQVFGLAMLPLCVVLVLFAVLAKEAPGRAPPASAKNVLTVLKHKHLWWFCFFYSVTFGGYVGLSSFLPLFYRDQYAVSPITAGYLTAVAALVGSLARPIGGFVADRIGGRRLLSVVLFGAAAAYGLASRLPSVGLMNGLLVAAMLCLGMGNGAVFQMVPQRFSKEIGAVTGIVGAIGGLGGFCLPMALGIAKQSSGSFRVGFLGLASVALIAAVALRVRSIGRPEPVLRVSEDIP